MARIVICKKCGERKEHKALGLCRSCYDCQLYEKHHEKRLVQQFQWREENPDYGHDYHKTHREEILARKFCYRQEHQAEIQVYRHEYEQSNPEKKALRQMRRRARLQNLPDTLTEDDLLMILARPCFYCGEKLNSTLDHFVPLGTNANKACGTTLANSVAACRKCNSWKSVRMPDQILKQLSLI